MAGWVLLGLAVGAAAGSLLTWLLMRRTEAASPPPVPAPSNPSPPPEPDDELHQVLVANERAVADLEGRFRGRKRAAGPEEAPGPAEPPG